MEPFVLQWHATHLYARLRVGTERVPSEQSGRARAEQHEPGRAALGDLAALDAQPCRALRGEPRLATADQSTARQLRLSPLGQLHPHATRAQHDALPHRQLALGLD